jgi:hypothetical protein
MKLNLTAMDAILGLVALKSIYNRTFSSYLCIFRTKRFRKIDPRILKQGNRYQVSGESRKKQKQSS